MKRMALPAGEIKGSLLFQHHPRYYWGFTPDTPTTPSHYTDETPEGALEAMERRITGGGAAAQDLLVDALAQMELKVGELAEAVSRLGTAVPAPIVEAVEAVEAEMEVVEEEIAGRRRRTPGIAQAIREYIISLGTLASEMTTATVADALRDRFPSITERDVQNATRLLPEGTPRLGRKPTIRGRSRLPRIGLSDIPPYSPRGRPANPRTVAIRDYALSLGAELANTTSADIVEAISQRFPDITGPEVLSALSASWRAANNLPNLARVRRGAPPPLPPLVVETGEAADVPPGTSLLERLRRQKKPERQTRNGSSWSRRYYSGLTEAEHDANDAWFEGMLRLLKPDGILGVPNLQKAFNKRGEEVPFPGTNNPPNRMMQTGDPHGI